jgi:translation initiation factor IF-3
MDLKNWQIEGEEILLIEAGISKLVRKDTAIETAREQGLDLVRVGFNDKSKVAVCKIFDSKKMRYEQEKKKKPVKHVVKEIWFHLNTGEHDLRVKNNKVFEFLEKKYTVVYGMQLFKSEIDRVGEVEILSKFNAILKTFEGKATWGSPKVFGKNLSVTLLPITVKA